MEVFKVYNMDVESVDGDIVGGFDGMSLVEDGIGGGVENVFGVGVGEIGGKGDVEGIVDGRFVDGELGCGYWGWVLCCDILMSVDGWYVSYVVLRDEVVGWLVMYGCYFIYDDLNVFVVFGVWKYRVDVRVV